MCAAWRESGCGLPSNPQGRSTNTTAITKNSTTKVNFEKEIAVPKILTTPNQMQIAFNSAINSAATKAPGIDPIPPTTTTTKAAPMVLRSISRLAGSRGSCNAPPKPASKAPKANTLVKSHA